MTSDQVPAEHKTPESFFPGFWEEMGWGFGVGVQTQGSQRGRYGWSGGQGTDFFVDPDGTVGILLTQVELGEHLWPMIGAVPGATSAVVVTRDLTLGAPTAITAVRYGPAPVVRPVSPAKAGRSPGSAGPRC